jgi:hypothetical protein
VVLERETAADPAKVVGLRSRWEAAVVRAEVDRDHHHPEPMAVVMEVCS